MDRCQFCHNEIKWQPGGTWIMPGNIRGAERCNFAEDRRHAPIGGPVREIGTLEDFDGATVRIGVDHGTVTIRSGAQPSRFGTGGRAEFERLWAKATGAAEAWLDGHPEDDDYAPAPVAAAGRETAQ